MLALCYLALGPGILVRARTIALAAFSVVQAAFILALSSGYLYPLPSNKTIATGPIQVFTGEMPLPLSEPNVVVFDFLEKEANKLGISAFYTYSANFGGFDPWILLLIRTQEKKDVITSIMLVPSRPTDVIGDLRARQVTTVMAVDPWPENAGQEWKKRAVAAMDDVHTDPQMFANLKILSLARSADAAKLGVSEISTLQTPQFGIAVLRLQTPG